MWLFLAYVFIVLFIFCYLLLSVVLCCSLLLSIITLFPLLLASVFPCIPMFSIFLYVAIFCLRFFLLRLLLLSLSPGLWEAHRDPKPNHLDPLNLRQAPGKPLIDCSRRSGRSSSSHQCQCQSGKHRTAKACCESDIQNHLQAGGPLCREIMTAFRSGYGLHPISDSADCRGRLLLFPAPLSCVLVAPLPLLPAIVVGAPGSSWFPAPGPPAKLMEVSCKQAAVGPKVREAEGHKPK
jgi:hypothetical protein